MDVRVTKAMGNKGYDKIRLSVISNASVESEYFTYSSQFKYRWTSNYLSTGIVSVTPGQKTVLSVAGMEVEVLLPLQNEGIRGVIIADPCFQSDWIVCVYQKAFNTFSRTTELLNAINSFDDVSFWNILGDNFYDQSGEASAAWFAALSAASKAKVMGSVPGNHDFWVNSSPQLYVPKDQLGHGFMQFYGQDSFAASDSAPFDFSVDPDGVASSGKESTSKAEKIPAGSNFFYFHQLGNAAFLGFSGAHSLSSQQEAFEEACEWAVEVQPRHILLLGHWDADGDGCQAESVPEVYSALAALPQCAPLMSRMKYFMGHKHCNMVTAPDLGFMVGAQGMADKGSCGGEFGFPVLDTTQNNGELRVYYFSIAKEGQYDHYDQILTCIKANGVSGCYHLATLWTGSSLN